MRRCVNRWYGGTIGVHSLSQPFGLPAPSGREPGTGFSHSTGCSLNRKGTGDFHRPYETQRILVFTIHRGTLPQSRPLGVPAPSEREPGWGAYHSTGCSLNRKGGGRFSSPLRNSECFHSTIQPAAPKPWGYGRFSSPLRRLTFHRGVIRGSGRLRSFFSGRT